MRKGQNPRRGRGRNGPMRPTGQGGGHRNNNGQAQGQGQGQGQGHFQSQGRHRRTSGSLSRQFDSSGPEGKVRGTAVQLYERYKTVARETQAGDRVLSEAYAQFADHYYRVAAESGAFDVEEQALSDTSDRPSDGVDRTDSAADAEMETDDNGNSAQRAPSPEPNPVDGVLRTLGAREPVSQPSLLGADITVLPQPVTLAEDEDNASSGAEKRRRGRPRRAETTAAPLLEATPEEKPETVEDEVPAADKAAAPARRRGRPRKNPEADIVV